MEKVRDISGLYLNPPDKGMVLCVDEKTQIQALDRTQPLLPMCLGYVEAPAVRKVVAWIFDHGGGDVEVTNAALQRGRQG